jgi:hypothetical protein
MKQSAVLLLSCLVLATLFGSGNTAQAQQLEPRAYSPAPVGLNIFGLAAYYNTGNVVTDTASPIQNIHARIDIAVPFYGRTFGLFGRQASVTVATPVADAEVTGDVYEAGHSIDRTGIMDAQVRLAMNVLGGPALKARREHPGQCPRGAVRSREAH